MKNTINKFIVFFSTLMFLACEHKSQKPIQETYAEELVGQYIKNVESKYNLHLTSMAWGMYGGTVNLLGPGFGTKEGLDVSRSRQLLLELASELINCVNQSEKLRPYLKNYLFTIENVQITLSYRGNNPNQQAVKLAFLKESTITYEKIDDKTDKYETLFRESYDEAIQKLEMSSSNEQLPLL